LVGYGRVISDGIIYATIYDVIVKNEYKNQGIGKEILTRLISRCKERRIRSINLFAATGSQKLYERLGFVVRPADAPGMKYYEKIA